MYDTWKTLPMGKLESTRSSRILRHLLRPFHSQMLWAPTSYSPFHSLLLPWTSWTSMSLWVTYPKCAFLVPWCSYFQPPFPLPFTWLTVLMVTAWTVSFLKNTHLQNLFIQSFHSLTMASSSWWFKFKHHNCSLTSSQPPVHWLIYMISSYRLSYAFTSLIIQLRINFESIFPVSLLPVLSTSSPPCPFVIFMGKNSSAFSVSLQAAKRILRKKLYNLAGHFNS